MSLIDDIKHVFSHHAENLNLRMEQIEAHLAALATHETDPHDLITQSAPGTNVAVAGTFVQTSFPVCPTSVTWEYASIIVAAVGGTGTVTAQAFLDSVNGPPIGFGSGVGGCQIPFPSISGWVTSGRQIVINMTSTVTGSHVFGAQLKQSYLEEQPQSTLEGGN